MDIKSIVAILTREFKREITKDEFKIIEITFNLGKQAQFDETMDILNRRNDYGKF